MRVEDYESIIQQTAVYPKKIGLLYTALGLCGEAGEVAEKIKKLYRDNGGEVTLKTTYDLQKELGDVIWYVTAMASELGLSLAAIMEANYDKLIKRRETNTLHGSGDNREETNGITKS